MPFLPLAHLAVFPYEPPILTAAVLLLFLMFLGGSIGSFLNVVIYRLPAGLSIVSPRSRCPNCFTPILTRDNLPVIGWLLLRGRCRACRTPISMRYPLVEFTAAMIFTALACGEPLFQGWSLPISLDDADRYPLFGMCVYHFALLAGLGAATMIVYDGAVVPVKFWRLLLILGFMPPLIWPLLRPVPMPIVDLTFGRIAVGLVEGTAGLLLGLLLGVASWPAASHNARARAGHVDAAAMLGAIGLFLGWQAVAGIGLAAACAWSLRQIIYCLGLKPRVPWQAYPAVAALGWILLWRPIVERALFSERSLFGAEAPVWVAPAALVLTFAASLAGRKLGEVASRESHSAAS
ncbi:MAG: prepilin peptidase [Planctomycetia bacterium]|nr:prepilin peptidase [Planctomycetia bacterium]